jgi:threonine synthase
MFSRFARLDCTKCGASSERESGANLCAKCGGPLFARYEAAALDRDSGASRPRTIWRWHEMMPVADPANIVSLGEGGTPLLRANRLGEAAGFADLWI